MEIMFENDKVLVNIVRKDNKHIYFRISSNLTLEITCNKKVNDKEILKLIDVNRKSLTRMYVQAKEKKNNDNYFKYLGNTYTVVIDPTVKDITIEDDFVFALNTEKLDKFLKNETLRILTKRINGWESVLDFVPRFNLRIRKMKTRWGVCNKSDHVVTLNSELIKYDVSIIDYVIIHELCHFKYPNHQREFWELVSKYYPNYKKARKVLKEA